MSDQTIQSTTSAPTFATPLLIGLLAFVLFLLFQTSQILRERSALGTAYEGQNGPIQESNKARQQLELIAQKTADLAGRGDVSAQAIINDMARQGIKIDAKKPAATQP